MENLFITETLTTTISQLFQRPMDPERKHYLGYVSERRDTPF